MDSGTSNTRAYLIEEFTLIDTVSIQVGTKDPSISGNNTILLAAMKECYDKLLEKNNVKEIDVSVVWSSGMVTNTFRIIEVEHVSTSVDGIKLLNNVYVHNEDKYFKRNINLIRGVNIGPINHIPLTAVGGIHAKNANDFINAGCIGVSVGGNLVNKELIETGNFEEIKRLAQEYKL